jgi:hypothetical protein
MKTTQTGRDQFSDSVLDTLGNPACVEEQHALDSLIEHYEKIEASESRLFQRLKAAPFNHQAMWLLFSNVHVAAGPFVLWLAELTARVDDYRIRSVLAKQLNDEMGNGDFARVHTVLFQQLLFRLRSWSPSKVTESMLQPGRATRSGLAAHFGADNVSHAIGAAMVSEIFAKKFDRCLWDEINRQRNVDPKLLEWLTLHVELEVNHAGDSLTLARLVPPSETEAARRGAEETWQTCWRFLDDLESVCC